MKTLLVSVIVTIFVFVFSQCGQTRIQVLTTDVLPVQKFEIDTSKDTLIQTAAGMVVSIKAGSLSSSNGTIATLQIKEALQLSDMIKAGLTTTANGELLSSGGMFFIEPEDKSVKIVSPFTVYLPADFIEETNIYKGTERDEKINWEEPEPVKVPEELNQYAKGEELFKMNCATCHTIGSGRTIGPDLIHIAKRRSYHWLEAFTLNSQEYLHGFCRDTAIHPTSDTDYRHEFYLFYSYCLFNQYNKSIMTSFHMSREEIHHLYDYIENESARLRLPMPEDKLFHCVDSCLKYQTAKVELEQKRDDLIRDNGKLLKVEMAPAGTTQSNGIINTPAQITDRVEPIAAGTKYYQVNIKTFGWFNIDILLKDVDGVKNSNLIVRLQGTFQKNISLFLVIPSHKVFVEGGKLTTADGDYGFFEKDGTIPLPEGRMVYVFAVGEADGKFIFANTEFTATTQQTITLEPIEVSKEIFDSAIQKMGADGMAVSLDKTKNADQIKEVEKNLEAVENIKPKNCDCNCGLKGASESNMYDYIYSN